MRRWAAALLLICASAPTHAGDAPSAFLAGVRIAGSGGAAARREPTARARLSIKRADEARAVLLFVDSGDLFAFGHLWVEVWSDGEWQPLDATRPAYEVDRTYLPLLTFSDESIHFAKQTQLDVSSIEMQ